MHLFNLGQLQGLQDVLLLNIVCLIFYWSAQAGTLAKKIKIKSILLFIPGLIFSLASLEIWMEKAGFSNSHQINIGNSGIQSCDPAVLSPMLYPLYTMESCWWLKRHGVLNKKIIGLAKHAVSRKITIKLSAITCGVIHTKCKVVVGSSKSYRTDNNKFY